jgi:hypothetical protein
VQRDLSGIIHEAQRYHQIINKTISDDELGFYISKSTRRLLQLPWVKDANYPVWLKNAILASKASRWPEVSQP